MGVGLSAEVVLDWTWEMRLDRVIPGSKVEVVGVGPVEAVCQAG